MARGRMNTGDSSVLRGAPNRPDGLGNSRVLSQICLLIARFSAESMPSKPYDLLSELTIGQSREPQKTGEGHEKILVCCRLDSACQSRPDWSTRTHAG